MTTKTKKTTKKKTTKNADILVNVENLKMHFLFVCVAYIRSDGRKFYPWAVF